MAFDLFNYCLMPKYSLSEDFIQKAIHNPLQNEKCVGLHPGISCNLKMCHQFICTCKSLYKTYLLVHLIPFLLFKRKKLKAKPIKELQNLIKSFIKSMLFAGGYTLVVRRTVCILTKYYKFHHFNAALGALVGGVTLMFEPTSRQSQIALYCVNKTLQTIYQMGLRRGYPVRLPHGQCLLMGVAVGIICYFYVDCPRAIRQNYVKVLEKLIGNI